MKIILLKSQSTFSLAENKPYVNCPCGNPDCHNKADNLIKEDSSGTVIAICSDCLSTLLVKHEVN